MGYKASDVGTSFLTSEHLWQFQYGSSQVNLIADNTELETFAATGFDDGVLCQRWEILREYPLVGYATIIGDSRSRGSNRAESLANIPMVCTSSIGLVPREATFEQLLSETKRGYLH